MVMDNVYMYASEAQTLAAVKVGETRLVVRIVI